MNCSLVLYTDVSLPSFVVEPYNFETEERGSRSSIPFPLRIVLNLKAPHLSIKSWLVEETSMAYALLILRIIVYSKAAALSSVAVLTVATATAGYAVSTNERLS